MAEPRTGETGSSVLGVPRGRAGNRLCSEGVGSISFICLQHLITSAQTQAGGGNGRTSAAQAA